MLSRIAQVRRLRRLAITALDAYPLVEPRLRFVTHGENTTFRVDAATQRNGRIERFLLRVHRPGRHGPTVDSRIAVGSELRWLAALRAETELAVPEPVLTTAGELTTSASAAGVEGSRVCSILRWMDGRLRYRAPHPVHLRRLGVAMARLHEHADRWRRPPGFTRMRWDWEAFFGNTMEYGQVPAADVWPLVPDGPRKRFADVALRTRPLFHARTTEPGAFGLIHADLHLGNAVFAGDRVGLIDFDDCGFGYRLYDLAVALWELRWRPDYPAFYDALLSGYTQIRPAPANLDEMDAFIAVREVGFGLWFAGMAQVNPAFRDDLDRTLGAVSRSLDRLAAG